MIGKLRWRVHCVKYSNQGNLSWEDNVWVDFKLSLCLEGANCVIVWGNDLLRWWNTKYKGLGAKMCWYLQAKGSKTAFILESPVLERFAWLGVQDRLEKRIRQKFLVVTNVCYLLQRIQIDFISLARLKLGAAMWLSSGQWNASANDRIHSRPGLQRPCALLCLSSFLQQL